MTLFKKEKINHPLLTNHSLNFFEEFNFNYNTFQKLANEHNLPGTKQSRELYCDQTIFKTFSEVFFNGTSHSRRLGMLNPLRSAKIKPKT